jgi:hypothetical protein
MISGAKTGQDPARGDRVIEPHRISTTAEVLTLLACAWLVTWTLPHGGISFGRPLWSALPGQQLAATAWMMHLLAWCTLACKRLSSTRATTRIGAPAPSDAHP